MNRFFLFLFLSFTLNSFAQSITGRWKTIDDNTGKPSSVVEIYEKNGKYYGKVVEIIDKLSADNKCEKCSGDKKNKPILGLQIIDDMKKNGVEYDGGKILDPENGNVYKCIISIENKNKLKVRGYIGIPMLGRSQYWNKI